MDTALFDLPEIAFFGRALAEYERFYGIRAAEYAGRRVLDCPSGPSSFVAEARLLGVQAEGVDPLYALSAEAVVTRARSTFARITTQIRETPQCIVYGRAFPSFDQMVHHRSVGLERFCADFYAGFGSGRYRAASLPRLPYAAGSQDLVLSGHLLFTYAHLLDFVFHVEAVEELLRVCRPGGEVRIHPLVGRDGKEHPFVLPLLRLMDDLGVEHRVIDVDYEFFRGSDRTLVLRKGLERCGNGA